MLILYMGVNVSGGEKLPDFGDEENFKTIGSQLRGNII